ncbi:MAG TPA: aminotransferase class IV [Solirubrobacteraceae bacterium]|nr:aminotransferase class IV [Solirubrobacteraceae bacterium]
MPLAIVDGEVMASSQATIPILDDGLWRGDGVFEVVRLYRGRPWALAEHLERMKLSAENLRLDFSPEDLAADIATLLDRTGPVDAILRVAVTRGGRRVGVIEEPGELPANVALATIEHMPSPLMDAIKSLSYAANMLAARLAQERGADDALFVTPEGRVLETPRASFFCALDGQLCTPTLDGQILDSITRRHVLATSDVAERIIMSDDLARVGEAFVASTVREIQPVHSIDGRSLGATPGPLTRDALLAHEQLIAAALAAPHS